VTENDWSQSLEELLLLDPTLTTKFGLGCKQKIKDNNILFGLPAGIFLDRFYK
jgi:hypothetical protein